MGVIANLGKEITSWYASSISTTPLWIQNFINFSLLLLLIVIYAVIVWKGYHFVARKDPLGLNLNKYNIYEHSFFARLVAGTLYFIEYILVLPFLIFIAFVVFTLMLIILTQNENIAQVLIISATVIGAIRITSYYKEKLSEEIAKMLPLTLLAISVLNPASFSESQQVERIVNHLVQIPNFLNTILYYLLFIIFIEIVLRFFDFLISFIRIEKIQEKD
ncbi:MAG: hypothetical protein KKF68_02480 [Nanoarchaeota archaeon]|nr:hypothetical protein [Nanoarchaeota archaeon]